MKTIRINANVVGIALGGTILLVCVMLYYQSNQGIGDKQHSKVLFERAVEGDIVTKRVETIRAQNLNGGGPREAEAAIFASLLRDCTNMQCDLLKPHPETSIGLVLYSEPVKGRKRWDPPSEEVVEQVRQWSETEHEVVPLFQGVTNGPFPAADLYLHLERLRGPVELKTREGAINQDQSLTVEGEPRTYYAQAWMLGRLHEPILVRHCKATATTNGWQVEIRHQMGVIPKYVGRTGTFTFPKVLW